MEAGKGLIGKGKAFKGSPRGNGRVGSRTHQLRGGGSRQASGSIPGQTVEMSERGG